MHGPAIPIGIILLAAITWIIVIRWMKQKQRNTKEQYSKDHWRGLGIAIGMAIGMSLGLIIGICIDNTAIGIALGPALGTGIGIAIGAGFVKKYQNNTRKMTQKEKHIHKRLTVAAVILFTLFVLTLVRGLFF